MLADGFILATVNWGGELYGELGVVRDDGERMQCHGCGEWFLHLGSHVFQAHGLTADDYRREFGLMQRTRLGGSAWLEMRRQVSGAHMRQVSKPRQEQVRNLTTAQRRAAMVGVERRREHDLNRTEPERIRAARVAKYGAEKGYPDVYLVQVADLFVDELCRGQRGVYRRLGDRMGVDWSTARSRVMSAVKRGFLIWTGGDHEPAAHRPGEKPWVVPGSFEDRFARLEEWVDLHGHPRVPRTEIWEGVRLGSWVQTTRQRYRRGTLSGDRVRRLEALPGWRWSTR